MLILWRLIFLIAFFRLSECKENQLRLSGGSSSTEGRVEIYHNGKWGTVCDDSWDIDDGQVVCRSLGLPDAIDVTHRANYGRGSGEIWLDEVQCFGYEWTLAECPRLDWGKNNCGHGEDAGVVCGHPEVVNITVSGLAGMITSPGFPYNMKRAHYQWTFRPPLLNANMFVCFESIDLRTFGQGRPFRAAVKDSSDKQLFFVEDSRHNEVCLFIENVGGKVTFYAPRTTERDSMRNGFRIRYAVVDGSQRENFCNNDWDISAKGEAGRIELSWNVPTKQTKLDYKYLVIHKTQGDDVRVNLTTYTSVVIDNLDPSTEYSIQVVAIPLVNKYNYSLYSCNKRVQTTKEHSRLIGGKAANEGYIQVYHEGQWIQVCGNFWWNMNDAHVACRALGMVSASRSFVWYPKVTKENQHILLGKRLSNLWLSELLCSGKEKNLLECRRIFQKLSGWCHTKAASLVCKKKKVKPSWRITGGMLPNEGLVEFYHKKTWGRVCSEYGWNLNAAKVACRSMGLPAPPFVVQYVDYWKPKPKYSYYKREKKKPWIKNPLCDGTEKSLTDCQNGKVKRWNCRYSQYAHLVCGHPKVKQISITDTNGVITSPGYPDYSKQANLEWIFKTAVPYARVLLYFDRLDLRRSRPVPNERSSLAVIDGFERTLFQLKNRRRTERTVVVGTGGEVKVSFYSSFTYGFGGRGGRTTGFRVRYLVVDRACHQEWSISVQGKPGRILISWTAIDEITRQKDSNYKYLVMYNSTRENIKTVLTSTTSVDIDFVEPDTLYTVGVLAYISDTSKKSTSYYCSQSFVTHDATTRLVGGRTPFEGQVQVFHDGIWGTICDDSEFDINDATVICRSIGLPDATFADTYAQFSTRRNMKKWLRAMKCKGNETKIEDCKHAGWGNTMWCFNYDVGVVCGHPQVEHFNITNSSGTITSPGYHRYIPMMHHVYHFPSTPNSLNSKLIISLENIWLERGGKGESSLTVEDGTNTKIHRTKNKKISSKMMEFKSELWPIKITIYSSYSYKKSYQVHGVMIPYIIIDEPCRDWNVSITGKPGMIFIKMQDLDPSKYDTYQYRATYNSSTMATPKTKGSSFNSMTLYSLEPDTLYTVSVFAFPVQHSVDKPYRYCTKNVRTEDVKLRLSGGKFHNEGRLEMFYGGGWSTICGSDWDIVDANVACRVLGLPPATYALKYSEFGHVLARSRMNRIKCMGNETSLAKCPHEGWDFWLKSGRCSLVAAVVCGSPEVSEYNITGLTEILTSPGFPKSMIQAHYEWTFRPPITNANVLLCIFQLNILRGSSGVSEVSAVDADGHRVFMKRNEKIRKRAHVLLAKNPSTLSFISPFTYNSDWSDRGFKMRYFVFNESCRGKWNISLQYDTGSINLTWSIMESQKNYTYAIVYYPSTKNIKSIATSSTSATLDALDPDTEYIIRFFAFIANSTDLYFCSRRVRTEDVQWRLVGGKLQNEGSIEVNYKGQWGAVCGDNFWDLNNAKVACKSLGLPELKYAPPHNEFESKNTKFWLKSLKCSGSETNLAKCSHGMWKHPWCRTPGSVVCGSPKVQSHNITYSAATISSSGNPHYMLQEHLEWNFILHNSSTRILIEFEDIDLRRRSGKSKLHVEENIKNVLFSASNNRIDGKRRLLVDKSIKMTYFSSFTYKNKGMRLRYVFFDDSCTSYWNFTLKPGIGKLDVSWKPHSDDLDFEYLIIYNTLDNRNQDPHEKKPLFPMYDTMRRAFSPGYTIDNLPPNTMYTVTVLALHNDGTARYCTKNMRTRNETFRIAGGRIPNEGRVEIYHDNSWGVICEDDWDMNDTKVACRQAGFPSATWAFRYSPFRTANRKKIVLYKLHCKGSETNLWNCPEEKSSLQCFRRGYPASVICGQPAECKTEIKDRPKGTIRFDEYFSTRKVNCEWTITAPSKTTPIFIALQKLNLHYYSPCSESYLIYEDALARKVEKFCPKVKIPKPFTFVSFGSLKLRLRSTVAWYPLKIKVEYFIPNQQLENYNEAPYWDITVENRIPGEVKLSWLHYILTNDDRARNLRHVVKYVPVCVSMQDGDVISPVFDPYRSNTKALYRNLKNGQYTVYVLAYLADSANAPPENWKEARRSSKITLKIKEGRFYKEVSTPAPTTVIATTKGRMGIQTHNITNGTAIISSSGYPHYMLQEHQEWNFIKLNANTRILIQFDDIDFRRKSGKSRLQVEDDTKFVHFEASNKRVDGKRRFLFDKSRMTRMIKMTYFSSFTYKNKGMRLRYAFFDDSCTNSWNFTVKPGIGKLDVSWKPHSDDLDFEYLIIYNTLENRNQDPHEKKPLFPMYDTMRRAFSPGYTIDNLPPNTMYTVTVLALHNNGTARYCTKNMRTRNETFRLAGGRIASEGRVEIYHNKNWGLACEDDWDMNDAIVACRQAGLPPPTWVFKNSPFGAMYGQKVVLNKLQCKGNEENLLKCPEKKSFFGCDKTYPASVICGQPAECKTEIKDRREGTIRFDDYFSKRKVDCEWTITAPSKTTPILIALKKLRLSISSSCSDSSLTYIDALGQQVEKFCPRDIILDSFTYVSFGSLKLRLRSTVAWYRLKIKVEYFIPSQKLDNYNEAPYWGITVENRIPGEIQFWWPQYRPTNDDRARKLRHVVKYVPVCVSMEDGDVISPVLDPYRRNTKALYRNLKYGQYTVYVLAYLADSANAPPEDWKEARRSRNVTLKLKEGIPSQPPMDVTVTTTGTNSILATWRPIPRRFANGIIQGYNVFFSYYDRYKGGKSTIKKTVIGENQNSSELHFLLSETVYTVYVGGFTNAGLGPASLKVSTTTGYEVNMTAQYGSFKALSDLSNIHKTWRIGRVGVGQFDEILIAFKEFDLEGSQMCSVNYVKVTDEKNNQVGKFCGKKSPFGISIPKGNHFANVILHTNTIVKKGGFSAFYLIVNQTTHQGNVWNLTVLNTTKTNTLVSWDVPAGNTTDIMVLFKEESVKYIWQAVVASPLQDSVNLKGLLPGKAYSVRIVGSVLGENEASRVIKFMT